ncbi:glycosyltransferase family 4 protein [uncultured Porphyromonas sp.]|uniref:glycosyltransferase family 4 protein n=1 Tax=uncultured Porphyromonas sp. TaxID=159274 RepID=UPI0028063426|nr:glycosyltransferase family 4 protein [uncultured Porphyromonas sp.]
MQAKTTEKIKILRVVTSSISFKLIDGQAQFMQQQGYQVITASGGPFPKEGIAQLKGVRFIPQPHLVRPISIKEDLLALRDMIRLIRKERPDIIHSHTPKAGLMGMLAGWLCRVPIRIHTVAGLPLLVHRGFKRKVLNLVERITYRCATYVYPNSHRLRDTIISLKLASPDKLRVIGDGSSNGINVQHFCKALFAEELVDPIRKQLGGSFTFIFVGRIVRDKGICELVEAFTRLQQEHPDARLLLVGGFEQKLDPLPEDVYHTIQSHPAIYCAGWQDDVRPWFVAADALAFPSYREGFPNVVMQAGAMELPCVVSDINGCNEIIIEGENGLIIPSHDAAALYQAMKRMMEDKALYTHCQQNARPLIASRYKQEDVWQATLEMYRSLTGDAK